MSLSSSKRNMILESIVRGVGSREIAAAADVKGIASLYGISEQTVYRYMTQLHKEGRIIRSAKSKNSNKYEYALPDIKISVNLPLQNLKEDVVWNNYIAAEAKRLPKNAYENLYYTFSEILNNAIDHSEGTQVTIKALINEARIMVSIADDGIGIFNKVAASLQFEEKRFAVIELAKGKFTTAPDNHSGEGIFFSAKLADRFSILSDDIEYSTNAQYSGVGSIPNDNLFDVSKTSHSGTVVVFTIYSDCQRTVKDVFDEYTEAPDGYGFDKTSIPVILLEYGDDLAQFVSRSQAKRLMARIEKFKRIILDFDGIEMIGQGFADEIFRIFPNSHPNCALFPMNTNDHIRQMITRASRSSRQSE